VVQVENDLSILLPIYNPGVSIYGHWFIDILPMVDFFRKLHGRQKLCLVVSSNTPAWVPSLVNIVFDGSVGLKLIEPYNPVVGRIFLCSLLRQHDFLSKYIV
jgi:hypothetical protein